MPAPGSPAAARARASGRARSRSPRASTARPRTRSAARGCVARARAGHRAPDARLWRRSDSSASSNGSAASRSANRSPSSPSSSAPTVWLSDTDACAAPRASSMCCIGRPVASASSSFVASRPSSTSSRRAARTASAGARRRGRARGSCARGSRLRAGPTGGSTTSRRSRTCSRDASRTSRRRGSARACPPGSGRGTERRARGSPWRSRRRAAGSTRSSAASRSGRRARCASPAMTSSAAVSSLCLPTSARKSCRLSAAPGDLGRPRDRALGVAAGSGLLAGRRHADLEPDALELAGQLLDILVGELVLERERLELGRSTQPRSSAPSRRTRACSLSSNSCSWFCVTGAPSSFLACYIRGFRTVRLCPLTLAGRISSGSSCPENAPARTLRLASTVPHTGPGNGYSARPDDCDTTPSKLRRTPVDVVRSSVNLLRQ